jgi:hypothetical protein
MTRFLLLFLLCLYPIKLRAEMKVGGILKRNSRWNASDGPFYLTSDLLIPRGVRLTITAGSKIIIGTPSGNDTAIIQFDANDKRMISMKINGTLICIGRSGKRISFTPDSTIAGRPVWYGIVLDGADEQFTEITHTDIAGAFCGISIRRCTFPVNYCILEYNHIGINCIEMASVHVLNCVIAKNTAVGIRITESNPVIKNSIIVFNSNNGVWCDGISRINFTYNCVYGNGDGDYFECDPEYGINTKKNKNDDSTDAYQNLHLNPIFSGSAADSTAARQDILLPTEKSLVRDSAIAAIINTSGDPAVLPEKVPASRRYWLSRYSPCIDAGDPSKKFRDQNGSRNDMGIWGGSGTTVMKKK